MDSSFNIIQYFTDKGKPLLDTLIVFVVGWYGAKLLSYMIIRMMKRSSVDPIVVSFVDSILDICLKVLVIVTAIAQLGVNTSSLVTVIATAGAAIVLGLKDSMTGVVSGMIILFTKPFVKDDIVEINGYVGKIDRIEILYTFLLTFDNKLVVIPNNEMATSTLVNYSHEDIRRIDMVWQVHYDTDCEKAKRIIKEVIVKHPLTLQQPEPYVRISEFQDHAIALNVRVWAKTEDYYNLKDDLVEDIKRALDKNHIEIPYQQLDVHVINQENNV